MTHNVENSLKAHRFSLSELGDFFEIDTSDFVPHQDFPILIPNHWMNKIEKGNPKDPLLLQVLPQAAEDEPSNWALDAVGDSSATLPGGLIRKYKSRALLITSPACKIHCRYCFRRHFPYNESTKKNSDWVEAIKELENYPEVNELILSGGDPLTLSDKRFEELIQLINQTPQINTLRIHSRSVIVDPYRTSESFLDILHEFKGNKVLVVHCNHPHELDEHTHEQLKLWRMFGWTVLNQAVLLKGINDDSKTLVELSQSLWDQGVLPYYLNLLDRVRGTQHFEVDEAAAISLHTDMAKELPGYLVPRLIREIDGEPNKTVIA